jgi:site-specific DNA recombinase
MSRDKQENSIERQRSQVLPYAAARGYSLVPEYVDEGIAGDEFDKREAFQRLLRDAQAGNFQVIVVDEPSRLSRQDPIDFIVKVLAPLREAGVRVDTVSAGPLDYASLAGLILSVVHADKSSGETKGMSRRVLTRLLIMAQAGAWLGLVPYGYCAAGRGINRRLVVGDEEEVRVVQWIYDMIANHGWSPGDVVVELARRGVKPPKGNGKGRNKEKGLWCVTTVRKLVRRPVYMGDYVWNARSSAKHYEVKAGKVEQVDTPGGKRPPSRSPDPEDMIILPDTIPPLVDRETWRRAQEALERNRGNTSPKKPGEKRHLFTHLLVCGDCRGYLVGETKKRTGERYYTCSTYKRHKGCSCYSNIITEDVLLEKITETLQREYLNPEKLAELRQEMEAQLRTLVDGGEVERLRRQARKLSDQIDRGNENLALLPPDRHPGVIAKVRQWEEERDQLQKRARDLEQGEARVQEALKLAEAHLWRLREGLLSGAPEKAQAVIREAVSKVELHYTHAKRGKLNQSTFHRGVIYLACDLTASHLGTLGWSRRPSCSRASSRR